MEKAVAFPCSYKTVRTDHPFVKKLQDTAVILYVSRKGERWWMSILELENVEKIYGENDNQVRALRNINLKVEEGEFKALYGLVCDGLITIESAAVRKNLTVDEFQMKLHELNII